MSHIDLGLIRARHGDLDQAVDHGLTALDYERKTEASLLSHAADPTGFSPIATPISD